MKSCTFELIVNILTYAIKNKNEAFSQKDFKNIVYTKEFNNYDINEKISDGFEYLLKRGFLQLENNNLTYYEKYRLPNTIIINTENFTQVYKDLSKKIILLHEGKEMINDTYEVKDDYANVIDAVDFINAGFLEEVHKEELKITLSKILITFNTQSTAHYSLLSIIQLLELKSAMNIKIKTKSCEFFASNIKFNFIQFNDSSLIVSFDKCSFEIDSIDDILELNSVDDRSLEELLETSISMLETYKEEKAKELISYLKTFSVSKAQAN